MRKGLKIVLLISLMLVVAAAVVLLVVVDREKEVLTAQEFYNEMDDEGYEMVDVTVQYAIHGIDKAYLAVEEGNAYQIEFYELASVSKAESMFKINKEYFMDQAGSKRVTSSYGFGNYNVYSLTSNGSFMYLCRVDNTLLYIDVDDSYKKEVQEIIDELGY